MQNNDVVYMCPYCLGTEPCWCGNKEEYIKMWEFVYRAFMSCNPSI